MCPVSCYIWYSEEGRGQAVAPPSPLIAVPNGTTYPSPTNVQITVLLYDGPLLYSFNVAIKGLIQIATCHSHKQVYRRRYESRRSSKPKLH